MVESRGSKLMTKKQIGAGPPGLALSRQTILLAMIAVATTSKSLGITTRFVFLKSAVNSVYLFILRRHWLAHGCGGALRPWGIWPLRL